MRELHIFYALCPIVGQGPFAYIDGTQRVLLPPLRPLRSLLRNPVPHSVAPLPPRAGPHFFPAPCTICMADMSDIGLSTGLIEFILHLSLRRAPNPPPSDPVSRHRTEIVSSSLDQGSPAERISSSLALCPTLDLGSGPVISPVFGQGFFLPRIRVPRRPGHLARHHIADTSRCSVDRHGSFRPQIGRSAYRR
jgi:hypothetical protein